jgi:hypothetical protein
LQACHGLHQLPARLLWFGLLPAGSRTASGGLPCSASSCYCGRYGSSHLLPRALPPPPSCSMHVRPSGSTMSSIITVNPTASILWGVSSHGLSSAVNWFGSATPPLLQHHHKPFISGTRPAVSLAVRTPVALLELLPQTHKQCCLQNDAGYTPSCPVWFVPLLRCYQA